MPIRAPFQITCLPTKEFGELDYKVMKHVFDSQNTLGRLADESVYQHDVANRLETVGFNVAREVAITVEFDTFSKTYFLDLVVNNCGVYEFKSVLKLSHEHQTQLLNYLLLLNISHGKLINFRSRSIESEFINAAHRLDERRKFSINLSDFDGSHSFGIIVENLLRDWGTGLSLSLYQEAIGVLSGADNVALQPIPMQRGSVALGNQRFMTCGEREAFRVTAFDQRNREYESQLKKLIAHSALESLHWINVTIEQVTITTIK